MNRIVVEKVDQLEGGVGEKTGKVGQHFHSFSPSSSFTVKYLRGLCFEWVSWRMALEGTNKALRVTDWEREVRIGLIASSLDQFEERVRAKMHINSELTIRVVLESDGTEIDDEDYFATIEAHTCLMVLVEEQRWTPYKSNFILGLAVEGCDGVNSGPGSPVEELIWRLHQDLSFFPWLTLDELGKIAKMDREDMRNVVPDPNFLEFLQTLCERYLQDKDKVADGTSATNGTRCSTASILNDPMKLIRLYSKFNAMKGQNGGYFSFSSCGSEESLASISHPPEPPPRRPTTPNRPQQRQQPQI